MILSGKNKAREEHTMTRTFYGIDDLDRVRAFKNKHDRDLHTNAITSSDARYEMQDYLRYIQGYRPVEYRYFTMSELYRVYAFFNNIQYGYSC